ncbi:hypothetical protein J3A83DRAFT_4417841 [Scleroderma citrinum]
MRAARRNDRRTSRNKLASPYARPPADKKKKSLWSITSLFSFLNPFGKSADLDRQLSPVSDDDVPERYSPPQMHIAQQVQLNPGADLEWNLPPILHQEHPPPPLPPPAQQPSQTPQPATSQAPHTPPRNSLPFPLTSSSPFSSPPHVYTGALAKNLEPVARFLVEKAGQPLNDFEAAGIVDYIQKNVQGADKPEPFRFSTSPSRGSSPNLASGNSSCDLSSSIPSPRKTLTKNPNGVYRWQGAGSSRPRNRYQSPGFGSRPQPSRIKLSPPKTPLTTDTKRRRVDDEAGSLAPQRSSMPSTSGSTSTVRLSSSSEPTSQPPQPSTSFPMTTPNGKTSTSLTPSAPVTPKSNGVQGNRIRTTGLSTTPAVPSPLRQTWKGNDSPPQPPQASRPTRAADFMTELLKEVTPPKKPDVSNPYQTASPVKPPPKKPQSKRQRPAPKPTEKPKETGPELTAQEIIEATVPRARGYKRSRPPPGLDKARIEQVSDEEISAPVINGSSSHSSRFSSSTNSTIEVEEIVDIDEEESPSKKRKMTKSPNPSTAEIIDVDEPELAPAVSVIRPSEIIEPGEVPKVNGKSSAPSITLSPPSATSKPLFGVKSSAPKEPSKLRYSYQADKVEVVGSQAQPALPSFPSLFSPPSVPSAAPSIPTPVPAKAKLSLKDEVLAMSVDDLPKYTLTIKETVYPAGPSSQDARKAALDASASSLPTFDIKAMPARAMNGFNWTAAGLKPPTTSAQAWTCDLCGLENPESTMEMCNVCETPRPGSAPLKPAPAALLTPPVPPTPVTGFDWAAAGLTPPTPKLDDGSWTCSLCGLTNSASATDKCVVCEAPR